MPHILSGILWHSFWHCFWRIISGKPSTQQQHTFWCPLLGVFWCKSWPQSRSSFHNGARHANTLSTKISQALLLLLLFYTLAQKVPSSGAQAPRSSFPHCVCAWKFPLLTPHLTKLLPAPLQSCQLLVSKPQSVTTTHFGNALLHFRLWQLEARAWFEQSAHRRRREFALRLTFKRRVKFAPHLMLEHETRALPANGAAESTQKRLVH